MSNQPNYSTLIRYSISDNLHSIQASLMEEVTLELDFLKKILSIYF